MFRPGNPRLNPIQSSFFIETPSNPLTEISDIATLAGIAKKVGAWLAVDNCFCSPALQRPLDLGADLVIHSATKYLEGQGRVLGGAVVGKRDLLMEGGVFNFLRTAGPSMSPFNAWVILKGMETLKIRMEAHSANALKVARWLEAHPGVQKVYYPGLPSHPQYELARRQQKTGGGIVSFEVKNGKEAAWQVIDSVRMLSITANLGDVNFLNARVSFEPLRNFWHLRNVLPYGFSNSMPLRITQALNGLMSGPPAVRKKLGTRHLSQLTGLVPNHCPTKYSSLPFKVFGRGVSDKVGAQIQRPLESWRTKQLCDCEPCAGGRVPASVAMSEISVSRFEGVFNKKRALYWI